MMQTWHAMYYYSLIYAKYASLLNILHHSFSLDYHSPLIFAQGVE